MAVYLVRAESDEPNIQNTDDVRAFKYATCGKNGVVAGYLNELGYETSGVTFTLKTGEIIIDGWQIKVDASYAIATDLSSSTQFHTIYAEVDLSLSDEKIVSIKLSSDTSGYPTIDTGDDISVVTTGIARLELYRFISLNGTISNVSHMFDLLDGQAWIAKYASEDIAKGTIEERLTNLGFKEGAFNIEYSGSAQITISNNFIHRQGNYCIGSFYIWAENSGDRVSVTIPEGFRPKEQTSVLCYMTTNLNFLVNSSYYGRATLEIDGSITLNGISSSVSRIEFFNAGWEAEPIG